MQSPPHHNVRVSTCTVGDKTQSRNHHTHAGHHPSEPATIANPLTFYPAYAFKASPTWWKWVKLSCHDVHTALQPHEKYAHVTVPHGTTTNGPTSTHGRRDAPLLLFYLNHPIQFVQVIGVVVAYEEYFGKFWLFTVDDSSGANIDVTCPKAVQETAQTTLQARVPSKPTIQQQHNDEDITAEQLLHTTLSTLTIGTVVQAKGTLTTFRSTRQLTLLRLTIVPSTTHEMALISSRTEFYSSTLSSPWILSRAEVKKLRAGADDDKDEEIERARKRRKRKQKRVEREERHRRLIEQEYAAEEEEREQEAEVAKKHGERLKEAKSRGEKA